MGELLKHRYAAKVLIMLSTHSRNSVEPWCRIVERVCYSTSRPIHA
jgi:hypothetical protein